MNRPAGADSIDQFDAEYPEELPDRLQWLECRLRTSRRRLLRLLGLSGEDAAAAEAGDWQEIAARLEPQAHLVEHRLTHFLSYFRYDTEEALRFAGQFAERVRSGELDPEQLIPSYKADAPWAEREETLVAAILDEGPGLLPAVASFLSQPAPPE